MTETPILSSADVLRGQLEDILIPVPTQYLAKLDRITLMEVFDWVERVKDSIPKLGLIPPIPSKIKGWCNGDQLGRQWEHFTNWRPAERVKEQRSLFA